MLNRNLFSIATCLTTLLVYTASPSVAQTSATESAATETTAAAGLEHTTATIAENVILITSDGLRWEEVFRGVDADMVTTQNLVKNPGRLLREFDADTTSGRREKLMPFFWSHVADRGQIYGNRDLGSLADVENNHWFSYPGYNEFLSGYPDDERIKSNKKIPNPNATVFEWLNNTPALHGHVAAFGAWDVFAYIFNTGRSSLLVDDGLHPFKPGTGVTPIMETINQIRLTTSQRWQGVHFDSFLYPMAVEYLKTQQPRVLFIGLGETDEWAHEGDYENYLTAAHRVDGWLSELWELTQSIPQYRDKTTFIFTCDHGRGDSKTDLKAWNSHGRAIDGSGQVWMAVWGPDTRPRGEVTTGTISLSQTAATVAAAIGYDYCAAQPKAAPPLKGAITARPEK